MIGNSSLNEELVQNNTRPITAQVYLLSIAEIVSNVQQTGIGALPIVSNYILGLICEFDTIYLFDSHNKDENGNLSSSGT